MQQCTSCHKALATIQVTDLEGGDVVGQQYLCADCAQTKGVVQAKAQLNVSADLLQGLLGLKPEESRPKRKSGDRVCPGCSMTLSEFKTRGRLGCPRCYEDFRDEVVPLLERVHDACQHEGRYPAAGETPSKPRPQSRANELRQQLSQAIAEERYEEAAALRDALRRAEEDEA